VSQRVRIGGEQVAVLQKRVGIAAHKVQTQCLPGREILASRTRPTKRTLRSTVLSAIAYCSSVVALSQVINRHRTRSLSAPNDGTRSPAGCGGSADGTTAAARGFERCGPSDRACGSVSESSSSLELQAAGATVAVSAAGLGPDGGVGW
jgi:hypothetical protein